MEKSVSIRPYTIIGSTGSKDAFSRVFLYQPAEEPTQMVRGELFAIFSVAVPGLEIDWERTAIQAFNHLRESYFNSSAGSILGALEESLESTKAQLQAVIAGKQAGSGQTPTADLHLGALVVWGGTFIFRSSGRVYFSLFRNNELIDLSHDRFVQESIHDQDALVLGTAVLGERVGTNTLQKILQSELSDDWQQLLRDEIKDIEESALLSGLILSISIKDTPAEEEVIELVMPDMPEKTALSLKTRLKTLFAMVRQWHLPSLILIPTAIKKYILAKDVYLKPPRPSGSTKRWIIVIALLLLLVGSVYGTYRYNQSNKQQEVVTQNQQEISSKLQQIQEIAVVDRAQAQRAFDALQEELGQVQGAASGPVQEEIQKSLDAIYATVYLEQESITLPFDDTGTVLLPQSNQVLAFSPQQASAVAIGENGIYAEAKSVPELSGIQDGASGESGGYNYQPETGLWHVDSTGASARKIIDQTGQWGKVPGLATYVDNVYILAPEKNQVYKYLGLGGGQLGSASNYIQEPVTYTDVVDIAIDGHVYLLHRTGVVEKFLGGKRTDFVLKGVFPSITAASDLETQVDFNHLYLLADNTILVFTTDGEYIRRYAPASGQINAFTVSADESHLFLIIDGKLIITPLIF
jgi:hypothetical protein